MTPFALTQKYALEKPGYVLQLIAAQESSRCPLLDPNDLVDAFLARFTTLDRRDLEIFAYGFTAGKAVGETRAHTDGASKKRLSTALEGK